MSKIQVPNWAKFLYDDKSDYKLVYGGRGSGKSYNIALALLILGARRKEKILLCREFQKTVADSSYSMLKTIAEAHQQLKNFYTFKSNKIFSKNGTEWIITGLSQSTSGSRSIRSIEGVTITFIEEAQYVTADSYNELLPSVMRMDNSKLFAAFNPRLATDPIYKHAMSGSPDVKAVKVNWDKNPYLTRQMHARRLWMKKHEPELYKYEWEGELNPAANTQKFVLHPNLVEACTKAYKKEYETGVSHAGYDISDEGFDYCAYIHRIGPVIRRVERWSGVGSTLQISTRKVLDFMEEDEVEKIYYDATGIGATAREVFFEAFGREKKGSFYVPIKFNHRVARPNRSFSDRMKQKDAFTGRIAQMCWSLKLRAINTTRLIEGEDVDPKDCLFFHPETVESPKFIEQLSVPVYNYDSGKIKIDKYGEPEKETKRSPDMFDALILAYGQDSSQGVIPPYEKKDALLSYD